MIYCLYLCFFFFSSRRRHTRWNCDWSSDVCSSDLRDRRSDHVAVDLANRHPVLVEAASVDQVADHVERDRRVHEPIGQDPQGRDDRSEEHTSELQSQFHLVCRLLLEKKKKPTKDTS